MNSVKRFFLCVVHTFYSKKGIIWNFCYNAPVINSSGKDNEPLASNSEQLFTWTEPLSPLGAEFSLALNYQSMKKIL